MCLRLLVHIQDLLLIRVYYKNDIVLYADEIITKVCFYRSIITLKMGADYYWGGGGGGGVIPKYMKKFLQV